MTPDPMPQARRLRAWIGHHRVVTTLALAVVVILPAIAALASVAGTRWYPTGDMAQAELHMRGFFGHPPLVGAAGRIESDSGIQGSHPGPSLWVAMLPVYLLFGRSSFGLMAAVVSVHLAATWLALWLAVRRGGWPFGLAVAVALAVVVRASGPAFAIEPWNPWLAVIAFAAFVLAAWHAACGARWWYAGAVALGSHCIQCHAGYAPLVPAVLLAAIVADWLMHRRAADDGPVATATPRPMLAVAVAAAAGVLMWMPPLVDQFRRSPGNLSILYEHFVGPREAFVARGTALRIVASELSAFGPWATGPMLLQRHPVFVVLLLAAWASAVWLAWRSRDRRALTLHGLLAVTVVVGSWSVTRIFGGFQEYTIRWFWVVTALVVAATVWTWSISWRPVRDMLTGRRGWALATAALLGVTAVGTVQDAARARLPGAPDSGLVGAMAGDVAHGITRQGHYLVRWYDPVGLGATGFGLVLELERRGYHTGVDPVSAAAALPHRVLSESTATGVLWVVLGAAIPRFEAAGYPELAAADLRTEAERARFGVLDGELRDRLTAIGRPELAAALDAPSGSAMLLFINPPLPHDVAEMVAEYVALRLPAAVFLLPPGAPPPPDLAG